MHCFRLSHRKHKNVVVAEFAILDALEGIIDDTRHIGFDTLEVQSNKAISFVQMPMLAKMSLNQPQATLGRHDQNSMKMNAVVDFCLSDRRLGLLAPKAIRRSN